MTKREAFEKIKADYANDQEMVDFAESELAALDKRAAQAKAYKAKKAAASDELKAKIAATLTGEFQDAETITEAIAYFSLFREMAPDLKVSTLYDPSIDNNGSGNFKEAATIEMLLEKCFFAKEQLSKEEALRAVHFLLGSVEKEAHRK